MEIQTNKNCPATVENEVGNFHCMNYGVCLDCHYYSVWHGDHWCDRYNKEIRDPSEEKACYES